MQMKWVAAAGLLALTGCGGAQPAAETNAVTGNDSSTATPQGNSAAVAAPTLQLGNEGLWIALPDGKSRRAGFGVAREIAVDMIGATLGAPTSQGTNPECGAGPLDNVDFKQGLTLFFQDGKFVGWSVDGREPTPYRTPQGIGIGSTLQQIRDKGDPTVQSTSLGNEFTLGELGGTLSSDMPDGTVTNLWAGTTCAFR